uniref:Calcineurin-like phosphoesterase domain-containing protein n=1 Tax=Spongospora subterranea TaxID=70186 RepID=A0A0H5R8V7_9EUKA|eukprot:CRZ10152.1 hypothetical protein [Spongospora subterranea]
MSNDRSVWLPWCIAIVSRLLPPSVFVIGTMFWAVILIVYYQERPTPMLPIEDIDSAEELVLKLPEKSPKRAKISGMKLDREEAIKSPLITPTLDVFTNNSDILSLRTPYSNGGTNEWNVRCSRDLTIQSGQLFSNLSVQIASDLHIETICGHKNLSLDEIEERFHELIIPSAPYLVLAGDVGCPGSTQGEELLRTFLAIQSKHFKAVFVVAGNHEYYSEISGMTGTYLTAPEIHFVLKELCKSFPNVCFLDRKAVLIDKLRIVGATLWTDIESEREEQIESCVSDYRRIHVPLYVNSSFPGSRPVTVKDTRIWHRYDLKFITKQLNIAASLGQDVMVVTHHAPVREGTSHPGHTGSALGSAFANDLSELFAKFNSNLKVWVFGHTHFCCDFVVGGVRVISNQLGYHNDREDDYRDNCTIEI